MSSNSREGCDPIKGRFPFSYPCCSAPRFFVGATGWESSILIWLVGVKPLCKSNLGQLSPNSPQLPSSTQPGRGLLRLHRRDFNVHFAVRPTGKVERNQNIVALLWMDKFLHQMVNDGLPQYLQLRDFDPPLYPLSTCVHAF